MAAVQMPIIPAVGALIAAHPGTISLGQGVAYYGPPQAAVDRIGTFLATPDHDKYGPVQGLPLLVELIEAKLAAENGIGTSGRRVVVTAGANMAFLNALFAVTDPGDEVILNVPYYFNHEMAVRMLDCVPVLVDSDEQYQISVERIAGAVTPRTRAIVTVSPCNPSGAVYPREVLAAVNALARERGIYHVSDEAYENFVYGDAVHYSPASAPGAEAHTISIYSLSKAYGFASWRIGYMTVPEHLYTPILKAQDTNLICAALVSQHAAIGALEVGSEYCRGHVRTLAGVRRCVLDRLAELADIVTVPAADGALYLLLRVDTDLPPMRLIERLVAEHGVAAIPGPTFGLDEGCHLRVSYGALEPATVNVGMERLVRGLRAVVGVGAGRIRDELTTAPAAKVW